MTTLYMVTSGEYSDYGVIGIFSTRELAEECQRRRAADDIDEIVLDEMVPLSDLGYLWDVGFDLVGNVDYCERRDITMDYHAKRRGGYVCGDGSLRIETFGHTKEDAIKSAADTRRMALTMNLARGESFCLNPAESPVV